MHDGWGNDAESHLAELLLASSGCSSFQEVYDEIGMAAGVEGNDPLFRLVADFGAYVCRAAEEGGSNLAEALIEKEMAAVGQMMVAAARHCGLLGPGGSTACTIVGGLAENHPIVARLLASELKQTGVGLDVRPYHDGYGPHVGAALLALAGGAYMPDVEKKDRLLASLPSDPSRQLYELPSVLAHEEDQEAGLNE